MDNILSNDYFEKKLVESYQDFCLNWRDHLVGIDVQHFDDSGSLYYEYDFEAFMSYLNKKHNGTKFFKHT